MFVVVALFIGLKWMVGTAPVDPSLPVPPDGYRLVSIHPADDLWIVKNGKGQEFYFEASTNEIWNIADVHAALNSGRGRLPQGFDSHFDPDQPGVAWFDGKSYQGVSEDQEGYRAFWVSKKHETKFGVEASETVTEKKEAAASSSVSAVKAVFYVLTPILLIGCCLHLRSRTRRGLAFKPQPF
jgi:hypothetical protein